MKSVTCNSHSAAVGTLLAFGALWFFAVGPGSQRCLQVELGMVIQFEGSEPVRGHGIAPRTLLRNVWLRGSAIGPRKLLCLPEESYSVAQEMWLQHDHF